VKPLCPFSLAESALLFLPHNREREKAFRHCGFISCKLESKTGGLNGSVITPACFYCHLSEFESLCLGLDSFRD